MSFQKTTLENGSILITIELPKSLSSTFMILSHSGPIFDPLNKTGLSHFIEHLFFKGTTKYPTSAILSHELEKYGAISEGFSYQETNTYWTKIPKDYLPVAVDLLTRQLQYSLFRMEDIESEKRVVKEELNMVKSNPSSYIWELWSENIWNNNALGRIYTGNPTDINSFTKHNILSFIKHNYTSTNTVFVISGDIKLNEAKLLMNDHLTNYSNRSDQKTPKITVVRKNPIKVNNQETNTVTAAYGFLTTNCSNPDSHVLELIEYFLGRGLGSRLNQKITETGLTYSINSSSKHLSNTGYFLINFTAQPQNLNPILKIINKQLEQIKNGQFIEEELERAKG